MIPEFVPKAISILEKRREMLEECFYDVLSYQLPVTLVFGVRYTVKAVMGPPTGPLERRIKF